MWVAIGQVLVIYDVTSTEIPFNKNKFKKKKKKIKWYWYRKIGKCLDIQLGMIQRVQTGFLVYCILGHSPNC